ncbi:MAG: hypothetical protein MZW92_52550 [Comamonadaceae bacterium]|nr:hypothetical protein [Comamonadaceae bacterium]
MIRRESATSALPPTQAESLAEAFRIFNRASAELTEAYTGTAGPGGPAHGGAGRGQRRTAPAVPGEGAPVRAPGAVAGCAARRRGGAGP